MKLKPIWTPDDDARQNSNLAHWMSELGISEFVDFQQWSVDNRPEYWQKVTDKLRIDWDVLPAQTLDDTAGIENAVWFPGSKLNIANSCFLGEHDATAIVSQQPGEPIRKISYSQLEAMTNRVANSIDQAGFIPGDAIAVVLPMTSLSVPIYLGIVAAGCSVVSIADSFATPEIRNRLKIADAKAVFTYDCMLRAGKRIPMFSRVCESTEMPVIVLPQDGENLDCEIRKQDYPWTDFLSDNSEFVARAGDANECINVLFSSGTTGEPKAIPWNHLTPIKCAADGLLHQDIRPGHVVAWPTNLGWMMGPWLIFASLLNRATIALFEDVPMGEPFAGFVQDVKVNMLGVVPTLVKNWRETKCAETFDWSSIHLFSSTGETSGADDYRYLSSLAGGRPIIEYCGGTEIGGGYITSSVMQPNYPAAFSTAAFGLDFEILDENGIPSDEGELFLVPPSVGLSNSLLNRDHYQTYYSHTPSTEKHKLLRRHGDHFCKLADGVFVAGGRVDDTMNLGGIKVSSAEIERIVNSHDKILESAAIAVPLGSGPESLVIFVVLESRDELDTAALTSDLNKQLKQELNPLFKINQIVLKTELPRTASNKVMRRKLRKEVLTARIAE